ncbi:uncharacterized protein F5147DRAFT_654391 [Suillus discolor]|uniref:Fungal-type protein kinase domain-containing protein n=1 Tax=Suillus discolor TaxID=1912936 RepID=A0A9P7JSE7_9AGAM|nr:uncharacterized protein F5147DRAFT_654391 [Suillus discolor]KAG2104742.1 hypothetical protein F5147DRAFT_654391 [Suillus discolor]
MSPAGETGTSATPQRANASGQCDSKIESTPNSHGAFIISENISLVDVQVKEVRPWIQWDIEQAKQCRADAMLQALLQRTYCAPETKQPKLLQKCLKGVLPVCNGQVSAGGISSLGIKTALKEYPFIDATNIALACLEEIEIDRMCAPVSAMDMIWPQNNMPMYQTYQMDDQKDDTKDSQKRKAYMVKNAKPKPKNLLWKDVLACIEFKRKTGRMKGIKLPPSRYLPVDHLKAEVPLPGPSQSPATQPASDTAPQSSGLTAAQPAKGGSNFKRKVADTLESTTIKFKVNPDEPDVTIQMDNVIWTWYYDHQGTVQSLGINFIQDLPRFMVLLLALQCLKVHDWGRNKDLLPVQVEGKQYHKLKIKDEDLGMASRTSEPEILKKVEEIAKRHATVQDHVPELLWHHTFTNPTSVIREVLDVLEPSMGSCVFYILVFHKLYPIMKLQGKDLFDVWRSVFYHAGHLTLWKEGVHHQDVSPGNLMRYWKDGKQIGILNDYGLSSLADDPGPQGNEHTGMVPFIALDLLTEKGQHGKVKHLYLHDLESFMWCFAWISLHYENGVLLP